jgi:V-type H+-transporting ATPase subunit a
MPRYRELNPGYFAIIFFPFHYGVMYGGIGHGSMMLVISLLLIIFEKKFEAMRREKTINEMLDMVHGGRYILLLMALFTVYCVTIYNDVTSLPIQAYGSNYSLVDNASILSMF